MCFLFKGQQDLDVLENNDGKFEKLLCWIYSMVCPVHGFTRCMLSPVLDLQHGVSGPVLVTEGHRVQFAIII